MTAKHEVKLNLNITAYVVAETDDEAIAKFSSELEAFIMGVSHELVSRDIELDYDSFDLQRSEATSL